MKESLRPDEHELIGSWIEIDGQVRGDRQCQRIHSLTQEALTFVAHSPESAGWETLFVDPTDGRYWERSYPHGDMHGGGPPVLRHLPSDVAQRKYRIT